MKRSAFLLFSLLFFVAARSASAFNPNYLLSDFELTDGTALSKLGVADFLKSKGGAIGTEKFSTPFGSDQKASDIIYSAGKHYAISQKFLVVLLQKEQSLITATSPSQRAYDWATGFGVCDSCSKDDPRIQKYKGFFNQINWAARQFRERYLVDLETRGATYGWGPGITKNVCDAADGQCKDVTPENNATAALYAYTPHVYNGNANFVRLWNAWFTRAFPDGVLLREVGTDAYYLLELGKKRKFRSVAVVRSRFETAKALPATRTELDAYESGPEFVFPEYSLIRSPGGTVYLIVNGQKRGVASRQVFRSLGFNPEEVQDATWDDINILPDGTVITIESAFPTGALLQSVETGGIAYVENGVRSPIYSREVFRSRFAGRPLLKVSNNEIEQYPIGEPIRFVDGELVKTSENRTIYLISNGERRPIANREIFDSLGFKWSNVITTDIRTLSLHPLGAMLDSEDSE